MIAKADAVSLASGRQLQPTVVRDERGMESTLRKDLAMSYFFCRW